MPKEFRKRGKRSKKQRDEDSHVVYSKPDEVVHKRAVLAGREFDEEQFARDREEREAALQAIQNESQPAVVAENDGTEPASIWPILTPDLKAFFRQLEEKIIESQELGAGKPIQAGREFDENGDEIEAEEDDRVLLLRAALKELGGQETALATDAETSPILERLLYTMDDFARRVLADRFAGQYKELAKDRFASHVLQTLLILGGGETVDRERRGFISSGPAFASNGTAATGTDELPTLTSAILAITKELLDDVPALITSQHGSYILRTMLMVLSGQALPFNSYTGSPKATGRSRKSAKWKSHHAGNMKSFLPSNNEHHDTSHRDAKGKAPEKRIVPPPFSKAVKELVAAIDTALCDGHSKESKAASQSCRVKSDDPIATGLVQALLDIEHEHKESQVQNSMLDRLLEGLITSLGEDPSFQNPPRSDYIETLLRSTVSSHVLEKIIQLAPQRVFELLFKTYFQGRIARLAGHPVANFVCTKAVERANKQQVEIVVDEIGEALPGCIENSRTGVVNALLSKCMEFGVKQAEISKSLCNAFQTRTEDETQHLVPCGLALMTLALYRRNAAYSNLTAKLEYFTQGAILLQTWLRLPSSPVVHSVLEMPIERLLNYCSDPVASRVVDVFLDEENTAIKPKDRRTFLKRLLGHYHTLSMDRLGSRIADRCWKVADPFLKDKIAASLIEREYEVQSSQYGHYFMRKVNLPLYKRNPLDWRDRQAKDIGGTPAELRAKAAREAREAEEAKAAAAVNGEKRKRKEEDDEIDALFSNVKQAKTRKSKKASAGEAADSKSSRQAAINEAMLQTIRNTGGGQEE